MIYFSEFRIPRKCNWKPWSQSSRTPALPPRAAWAGSPGGRWCHKSSVEPLEASQVFFDVLIMPTCSCQQTRNFPIRDRLSTMSWLLLRWSHTFTKVRVYSTKCANISRVLLPRQTENLLDRGPWKTTEITSWCPAHLQKLLSALEEVFIRDLNASLDVLVVKPPNTFFRLPARVTHWEGKKRFLYYYFRNKLDLVATHPIYLQTFYRVWLRFWY